MCVKLLNSDKALLSYFADLLKFFLVDDLVKTVGELVVEVELAVIRFVFLQPQLGW